MRIKFAHLRERTTTGQLVDFAIFNAKAVTGTDSARGTLLFQLTVAARTNNLKVDAAALAYEEHGRLKSWGAPFAVDYLAKRGVPTWTHYLDV
jgi:hypothetical protein